MEGLSALPLPRAEVREELQAQTDCPATAVPISNCPAPEANFGGGEKHFAGGKLDANVLVPILPETQPSHIDSESGGPIDPKTGLEQYKETQGRCDEPDVGPEQELRARTAESGTETTGAG